MSRTQLIVGDAAAAKIVFNDKIAFGKPVEDYKILTFFGPNVIATEGLEWKRHRKLTAPAFSESNNASVWNSAMRLTKSWFTILDKNGGFEPDSTKMTLRLALMVIASAGFGIDYSWPESSAGSEDTDIPPPGRKLGFLTCLQGTAEGTLVKLAFPEWAYKLPFKFPRHTKLSFDELEAHLRDMIMIRRDQISAGVEHSDLFSKLLQSNGDGETPALSTEELLGNIYIFLLAGHETSAHTIGFMLTLLALHPQHQETLHLEAKAAFGSRESTYSDYTSLPYALATIHETLRLFPPVILIPKVALQDSILPAVSSDGLDTPIEVLVQKGDRVGITPAGIHFNPRYYDEPYEFRPSRFLDTEDHRWNRDAFVSFAAGSRACIGQKFSLVESVAILSMICLNYKIEIPTNLQESYKLREGESERDRRERVLNPTNKITLTPGKLPLTFTKRV